MPARPRELTPDRSARHLFGAEMRRCRTDAEMSQTALAGVVGYSKSAVARFETAEAPIPPDLPRKLDASFDTDLFSRLYVLARREVHPDKYRRRMELEAEAAVFAVYTPQIVPGLLQTPAYAEAQFRLANPLAHDHAIADLVAARMGRQGILTADPPCELDVVLDEAVIRRRVGSRSVMRAQLSHLLQVGQRQTCTVQLLPFSTGGHGLLGGTVEVLTLRDGRVVAYEEAGRAGTLYEERGAVFDRQRGYDRVRSEALSSAETEKMIRAAMEELADD